MNDSHRLSHAKWRCKYHIVIAQKYRRQAIGGDIRKDIGVILRKLCEHKKVEIIGAELCPDYIHMPVGISPHIFTQLQEDVLEDQVSLKEFIDPFTGTKSTEA